jgi:hypothetical protein
MPIRKTPRSRRHRESIPAFVSAGLKGQQNSIPLSFQRPTWLWREVSSSENRELVANTSASELLISNALIRRLRRCWRPRAHLPDHIPFPLGPITGTPSGCSTHHFVSCPADGESRFLANQHRFPSGLDVCQDLRLTMRVSNRPGRAERDMEFVEPAQRKMAQPGLNMQ